MALNVYSSPLEEFPLFKYYVEDVTGMHESGYIEAEDYPRAVEICNEAGLRLKGLRVDDNFDLFFGNIFFKEHLICKN